MSDYEYDENLPYVVTYPDGTVACRTDTLAHAKMFRGRIDVRHVIDTTPKPRVPNDAKIITWVGWEFRHYAERLGVHSWVDAVGTEYALEDLPGTRPSTVFTVLDERKSDD